LSNLFDNLTFEKIVIPVLAALITTLLVEYFAKPGLEARKTRLIRDREQFDKVVYCFQRVSASLSALPVVEGSDHKVMTRFTSIMLNEAKEGLYALFKETTQLSYIYVLNHKEHVDKTGLFVGYLLAQVELAIEQPTLARIKKLKALAEKFELFDVYYLVYVYMYDSQAPSYRRIVWRIFKKKKNNQAIDKLLSDLNLSLHKDTK
jgi:hypothetical protein